MCEKRKLFGLLMLAVSFLTTAVYIGLFTFVAYLAVIYDYQKWPALIILFYWISILTPLLIVGFALSKLYRKTYRCMTNAV